MHVGGTRDEAGRPRRRRHRRGRLLSRRWDAVDVHGPGRRHARRGWPDRCRRRGRRIGGAACAPVFQRMRGAASSGRHDLEQRLARWPLLAHDRTEGDDLPLRQGLLATMLGVHRPSVPVTTGVSQRACPIRRRGRAGRHPEPVRPRGGGLRGLSGGTATGRVGSGRDHPVADPGEPGPWTAQ